MLLAGGNGPIVPEPTLIPSPIATPTAIPVIATPTPVPTVIWITNFLWQIFIVILVVALGWYLIHYLKSRRA